MNKLTENKIRKAEIREKQYKIYDGDGMFLLIHPNGSKYWRMKYTFDGKSKLASFGVWPGISLKEARERRNESKQKIKNGINPVKEKHRNIHYQQMRLKDSVKSSESKSLLFQWSRLLTSQGKKNETEASLLLLKSCIFGKAGIEPVSLLDKQELNEIIGKIYKNRSVLYQIIWKFYLNYPIINIAVLFLLLLIAMGFFPALLTTVLYFILTVCAAAAFGLWKEKKLRNKSSK